MRDEDEQFDPDFDGDAIDTVEDRRRAPRTRHRVVFTLRPLPRDGAAGGAGESVDVVLQDLSITGMGVIHSAAMREGDVYQIPLARGSAEPLSLVATVVRCEQLDDGLFTIGFEFNSSAEAVDAGSRHLTGRPAFRP